MYGDNKFVCMPAVVPELADQCVIVNGVAKTYAMTGWRVGWMIGPTDVMKAAINFQSHSTSNVDNVAQVAALAAVSGDLSAVAMMRDAFARRAVTMHNMLNDIPDVTAIVPQGAFYCYPNFTGLLGRPAWPQRHGQRTPRWSSPTTCSARPRWRSCPARRSAHRVTPASASRWPTPTWRKASAASTNGSRPEPHSRSV